LCEAHALLDAAVCAAYNIPVDVDPLAFLRELNLSCAAREKKGQKVTAPGLPFPSNETYAEFVTEDALNLLHHIQADLFIGRGNAARRVLVARLGTRGFLREFRMR
jgi:hypothetical protein